MFNGPEIWIIILLVVVLFGGKRLPNIARNLGKAQSELKKGLAEGAAEAKKDEAPKTDTK
ncbi:MAG: twin-arginine translocase TatA/TatE family subunit [Actinobacteria bacterium]|jgi:sec-independent protein translocase protein TatA|nr:MAG: twin-arginine translocase TatA/TatE family subunit [Actinomycetota bacterium]